jgi:S1-C subfamily serine protease
MNRWLTTGLVASSAFAGGLVAEAIGMGRTPVAAQGSPLPPPPTIRTDDELDRPSPPSNGLPDFERVIRRVSPTVVSVDATKSAPATPNNKSNKPTEESGSGVLMRFSDANTTYVVTNNHVITGARAEQVTVTLSDGRVLIPTQLLVDPESDIALLRVSGSNLPTLTLGNSDQVPVGQWVLAFGSPFGLNQTVTHGIISARDRGQISLGNTIRIKEFLQTDAAINPGSSGGPLVDLNGQLIGINTAIASNNGNNSGVSFSIPSNLVRRIAMQLLERGQVARGYLGMQLAPSIEPATALRLGLSRVWGAMVEGVHPGGPAANAGLSVGDVILQVDGVEIRDENHLINLVSALPAGQKLRLSIWRSRRSQALEVTVGAWPGIVASR